MAITQPTGNDPDGLGDAATEPLNTGISVVMPIDCAIELIDGPILGPKREEIRHVSATSGWARFSATTARVFTCAPSSTTPVPVRLQGQISGIPSALGGPLRARSGLGGCSSPVHSFESR
jgi:hypothetical protein